MPPIGEGQHAATYRVPEPLHADRLLYTLASGPLIAGVLLLGRTVFRRPLPTSMPTKTSYWLHRSGIISALLVPLAANTAYCNGRLHSRILERVGIDFTPFRWWKRSDRLTQDDGFLIGGIAGLVLSNRALSIQALSKGYRSLTHLGAFCAGGTTGSAMVPIAYSLRHPGETKDYVAKSLACDKMEEDRLKTLHTLSQNETFMDSLSPWIKKHSSMARFRTKHPTNAPCSEMSWLRGCDEYHLLHTHMEKSVKERSPQTLQYPSDAAQLELESLKREASFLAAQMRPRAITIRDADNYKQVSDRLRGSWRDTVMEYTVLLAAQCTVLCEIAAWELHEDPSRSIHDVIASANPDAHYIAYHDPERSIRAFEGMQQGLQTMGWWRKMAMHSLVGFEVCWFSSGDISLSLPRLYVKTSSRYLHWFYLAETTLQEQHIFMPASESTLLSCQMSVSIFSSMWTSAGLFPNWTPRRLCDTTLHPLHAENSTSIIDYLLAPTSENDEETVAAHIES